MKATKTRFVRATFKAPSHWRAYWLNEKMRWVLVKNAHGLPIMYRGEREAEEAAYYELNRDA